MDTHVKEYFRQFSDDSPTGTFHKVIPLHECPDMGWMDVLKKAPKLPKGWFELAELPTDDRIQLLRDYWLTKIPFILNIQERIDKFFLSLDDIGIYLVQHKYADPFHTELVYSLKDNGGFFRGKVPATDEEILSLQKVFPETILPEDYMSFMRIHSGFSKVNDTGITPAHEVKERYDFFQKEFFPDKLIYTQSGEPVNPKTLIPFYESFGMPYYQCFWSEWYPQNEMGNVYYSGVDKTISSVKCLDPNSESLAFFTFTDWLIFYLEKIA